MQWSKLQSLVESKFARSVSGKVRIHSTSYFRRGNGCNCGRGWITYNKEQIVEFETILHLNRAFGKREKKNDFNHIIIEPEFRTPALLSERGEWSRFQLHQACKDFLDLRINDAINSENPLIQGLAFLDKRFGKRRLAEYSGRGLHPFAKKMLEIRKMEEPLSRSL